jgi:hypothetical protein
MTVTSFLKVLTLDLTTEVVVQAAPLLAQVSPVRHAAILTGEKDIPYVRNGADTNGSRPPGAIAAPDYARGLDKYDKKYQELSGPIWEEYYLCSGKNLLDD